MSEDVLGLRKVTAAKSTFEYNGKTYRTRPLTVGDIGEIENRVLLLKRRKRIKLLADVGDLFPPEKAEELMAKAISEAAEITEVGRDEIEAFMQSRKGVAFMAWMLLDGDHGLSLEEIEIGVCAMSDEEFHEALQSRDQAAGFDKVGNSTGSPTSQADGEQETSESK